MERGATADAHVEERDEMISRHQMSEVNVEEGGIWLIVGVVHDGSAGEQQPMRIPNSTSNLNESRNTNERATTDAVVLSRQGQENRTLEAPNSVIEQVFKCIVD